jgi:hypothetical protein
VVTVQVADLGAVRLTAVDAEEQTVRATEYRAARQALDDAIRSCRLSNAFEARRRGVWVSMSEHVECRHLSERRTHAIALKSHAGRLRALASLTEYVRKL